MLASYYGLDGYEGTNLVINHVRELLRTFPEQLRGATFIIAMERYANEAFHNMRLMSEVVDLRHRFIFMREGGHDQVGMLTSEETKATMVLQTKLQLQLRSIRMHARFASIRGRVPVERKRITDEFRNQLIGFRCIEELKRKKNGAAERSVTYTGKIAGGQDDITMAFMISLAGYNVVNSASGKKKYSLQGVQTV